MLQAKTQSCLALIESLQVKQNQNGIQLLKIQDRLYTYTHTINLNSNSKYSNVQKILRNFKQTSLQYLPYSIYAKKWS